MNKKTINERDVSRKKDNARKNTEGPRRKFGNAHVFGDPSFVLGALVGHHLATKGVEILGASQILEVNAINSETRATGSDEVGVLSSWEDS